MRRVVLVVAWAAALGLIAANAQAAPAPAPKATGSIIMTGPIQAASFSAFDLAGDEAKGEVWYTNFEYPAPGSGVWVPSGTFDASFEVEPAACFGSCVHRLTVTGFEPLSPGSVAFWGTGFYVPDPGWTETFTGVVDGSSLTMSLVPDDLGAKYGWTQADLAGVIAPDGSVSGTWSDTLLRTGTFEIAGMGYEVFSYTASVDCAVVTAPDATFGFTIPDGTPLAGIPVVVRVHDGGPPGQWTDTAYDTWAHGVGTCGSTSVGDYPIVGGNLTVHA